MPEVPVLVILFVDTCRETEVRFLNWNQGENKSPHLRLLEKTHVLFRVEHLQIPIKGKIGERETVILW